MPDVFVNYRTGDGDKTAVVIERELSHRFGEDAVFRASKSIKPGERYPEALLSNVRRSAVLLAVIGPDWTRFPALHDENDWVRREILEALACGIPVIPVLDGRGAERLRIADLPAELKRLADYQSVRLDLGDAKPDLDRIADRLTELVPTLRDRIAPESSATVNNQMGEVHGTAVQSRDITGDVGTVVKADHGQFNLGKGDQRNVHFSGPGATYVEGINNGGIRHRFGDSGTDGDDGR
ncbi:toll/interleukin-1 receptor domain-containing protein [Microtetraspora glauca]|uniref:Toll/interleukin-1 receptor domain-containing protein n=1 Tax=Microtetraspora glauca TaxID=1996 RepID=A0ABV3GTM1_MICGL